MLVDAQRVGVLASRAEGKELERVGVTYVFWKTDLDGKIAVVIA